jgi:5'(3')-deoxyribonucleotidase
MKICSDVDGVILNYIQGFIDFTQREKIPYTHDPEIYGVIRNLPNGVEMRDQFHGGDDLRQLNYFDDSLKILNKLASQHELHLVTALEPEQTQKRTDNLKELNYASLQCVGDLHKEQIIVEEVQPDVMLEDRPELIKAFYNAGISVLYPDWHLYTKGMDRFATPFSSWLEIPELLQNTSKLN